MSNLEQHLASLIPAAAPAGAGSPGAPPNTLSAAMQRRIHHNIQLAARCARLEAQKQALEAEKAELNNKLDKAHVSAAPVQIVSFSVPDVPFGKAHFRKEAKAEEWRGGCQGARR